MFLKIAGGEKLKLCYQKIKNVITFWYRMNEGNVILWKSIPVKVQSEFQVCGKLNNCNDTWQKLLTLMVNHRVLPMKICISLLRYSSLDRLNKMLYLGFSFSLQPVMAEILTFIRLKYSFIVMLDVRNNYHLEENIC